MGLNTTHGCWDGAYSSFNRWRGEIAKAAGLPDLNLMEGFYHEITPKQGLPIKWETVEQSPLLILLNHSDCDGQIHFKDCSAIADELEKCLPNLSKHEGELGTVDYFEDCIVGKTKQFIAGLRLASKKRQNVKFH